MLRETVLAEHKEGDKSVRKLALKYGMSKTAVGRLVSGKTQPSSKRGRAKTLPAKIEEQLVQALIRCSHAHVGFDPDAFRRGVGYYARGTWRKTPTRMRRGTLKSRAAKGWR